LPRDREKRELSEDVDSRKDLAEGGSAERRKDLRLFFVECAREKVGIEKKKKKVRGFSKEAIRSSCRRPKKV